MALDPQGRRHHTKVLSSSALRGAVEAQLDATRLRVRVPWEAPADFIRGFRFRALTDAGSERLVARFVPAEGLLELAEPLSPPLNPGSAFEVLSPDEAPVLAARLVTGTAAGSPLPPLAMRLGTTRGTNALLERQGARVALFITRGFGDALVIGTQQRKDLFALAVEKPEPLYEEVVEVQERIGADGSVIDDLGLEGLEPKVGELLGRGVRVAAVTLLNAYKNPRHEERLRDFLIQRGFEQVSVSSELAPRIQLPPRAESRKL